MQISFTVHDRNASQIKSMFVSSKIFFCFHRHIHTFRRISRTASFRALTYHCVCVCSCLCLCLSVCLCLRSVCVCVCVCLDSWIVSGCRVLTCDLLLSLFSRYFSGLCHLLPGTLKACPHSWVLYSEGKHSFFEYSLDIFQDSVRF